MFFDYASRGAQQGRENRNRQRRELAQAFQQFQAANPEATMMDFQSFIDSMAGNGLGSNYIRGGAPSRDVLQSLAEQGAARKQQRLLEQTSANFRRRAEDLSTLEAMADRAVLNMNGDDFDGAYDTFVQSLGPNGQQIVNGMNLRNRFTIQNRDTLMGRRLMESMPQIDNYLNMYGYNTEALDPEQMSRFFGLPANQMQPFIEAANRKIQMSMQEWRQTNNSNLMQVARDAATTLGPEGVEPALRNYLQNSPFGEQMLEGFDFAPYVAEAERIVSEREEQNQIESQRRVNDMIREWEQSDRLERYLRDGNNERALQHMFEIAGRTLSDADFPRLYGKTKEEIADNPALAFQSDLDRYVGSERDVQEENYATRTTELDAQLTEVSRTFVPNNQERLTEVFKSYFDDQVAGTLGRQIGSDYAYSPQLETAVFQIMSALPEDVRDQAENGAAPAVAYILQQLQEQGFAPNIEETRNQFIEQQRQRNGLYQPQTFDDWFNAETDEINSTISGYREGFNQMLEAYNDNPQVLASELMKLKTAVETFRAEVDTEMQARRATERTWLYYNSGGWDQARVQQGIIDPVGNTVTELSTMIEQAIAQANERAAASEDPPVDPTAIQVDAPDQEGTVIGTALREYGSDTMANQQIRAAAGFATDGTWLGMPQGLIGKPFQFVSDMFSSEAEYERRLAMRDYIESAAAGVNEYGSLLLQNGMQDRFNQMLRDIETMTPEQFEAKYAAAINQLKQQRTISTE